MKRRIAILLMLGVWPWTGVHAQQTASTTFRVSTMVQAVCEVVATNLDFGIYTSNNKSPQLGTSLVRATCSPQTTYEIGLNEGTSTGATVNQRKLMSGVSANMNYQLYRDTQRSSIWGNTPGTDTVTGTGTGVAVDHTVYGTIPPGQVVVAEEYSDTITVRVFY